MQPQLYSESLLQDLRQEEIARVAIACPANGADWHESLRVHLVMTRADLFAIARQKSTGIALAPLCQEGIPQRQSPGLCRLRVLNCIWRKYVCYSLASNLLLVPIYVPTRLNPADGPSRIQPIRTAPLP
eukprot:822390-Amphidinium_carterae.2